MRIHTSPGGRALSALVAEIFSEPFGAVDQETQLVVGPNADLLRKEPFGDCCLVPVIHGMVLHRGDDEQLAAASFVELWTTVVNMRAGADLNPAPVVCMHGRAQAVLDTNGVVASVVFGQPDTTRPFAAVAVFESAEILVYDEVSVVF